MSNLLPMELYYHILEYTGKVRLRNGKYMNQISKTDPRYDILERIPKKHISHNMIFNQMCWVVNVFTDKNECLVQYLENHPSYPYGEISITYFINPNIRNEYILGNKFPPCFVHSDDYKITKKWIEYVPNSFGGKATC